MIDYETLLNHAVVLGIRVVTRRESTSPEVIEHLLHAAVALACDHAEEHDLDAEEVLRTLATPDIAAEAYRRAYATEIGVKVEDLHRDVGWWPDGLPLFAGMPAAFVSRVARAEAAQDRARCAAMRELGL